MDFSLTAGAKVFVKGLGQEGTLVTALKDQRWEVAVGNLKCVVSSSELEPLEKLSGSAAKRVYSRTCLLGLRFKCIALNRKQTKLTLVGCTVDEAISRADKFLDMAYMASIAQVRLIHGSGMGILRRLIAEWLSDQQHVGAFQPADPQEGGSGVTVVSLKV